MSRCATVGALAAALALAGAGPAFASAPGSPGLVNVEATYTLGEHVQDADPTPGTAGDHVFNAHDFQRGTGVASVHSPGWPPVGGGLPTGPVGCSGDCGSAAATAAAQADAGGVLESFARTVASVNASAGGADANAVARVNLNDTITLSQAAAVVLRGRVRGTLDRVNDGPGAAGPDASLAVALVFGGCQDGDCPPDEDVGFVKSYAPGVRSSLGGAPTTVDETFAIPVALPAGLSTFNAQLRVDAAASVQAVVAAGAVSQSVRADATRNDDADRVEFTIEVPAGVTATSGSGKLPLTGGVAPQPPPPTVAELLARLRATVQALPLLPRLLLTPPTRQATCAAMQQLRLIAASLRVAGLLTAADARELALRAAPLTAALGCG